MPSHAIEIRDLYKIFGPNGASYVDDVRNGMSKATLNEQHGHVLGLKDINITCEGGEITVVMGLSGSGKSTLIRHINRLIEPTAGDVLYEGMNITQMSRSELQEFRRHKTAMVFQRFALLPHRTVMENAIYGLTIQGIAKDEAQERGQYWLDRVGLTGYEQSYPNQLSGGMQQRVGLARALANDADILLMDEAYSALDPLIRMDMQGVLLDLQAELKKTVVFITHDLDEALRLGDKIAILRDGEVVQQGTGQEIVLTPADAYISDFVREVNRGRVIMVDTIMTTEPGPTEVVLETGMHLEDAAKRMVEADAHFGSVQDEAGRSLGRVGLQEVISAMVTPISHEDTSPLGNDNGAPSNVPQGTAAALEEGRREAEISKAKMEQAPVGFMG